MTIQQLKELLQGISGFADKVIYYAWPEGKAPALPFICFFTPDSNGFGADNKVYYSTDIFRIELYTNKKDTTAEASVETALNNNDIFYKKSWAFIKGENVYLTLYEIEV